MKKTTKKRIEEIYNYILLNQRVSTAELAKLVEVSPEMIRKDLAVLEASGSITRVHGGAILRTTENGAPFSARKYENKLIKDELCQRAIQYVKDGDVIFIDASSTALQLGRLIKLRKDIVVVTNCLEIVKLASDSDNKISLIGGTFSKSGDRTIGAFAVDMIRRFTFDVAFIGTDGVKDMDGPGTFSEEDIGISDAVIKRSKKNVLMMDATKFKKTAPYTFTTFDQFDVLITDEMDWSRKDINIQTIDEIK